VGEQLWTGGWPMEAKTRSGRAGADCEDSMWMSRLRPEAEPAILIKGARQI
jgi:hypothetical protein